MKKAILFLLPFLYCLVLLFQKDISFNQDLGRHIKTGEIILQEKMVPSINFFSYTQPNHPFVNHHWGSEVLFYILYSNFGEVSLLVVKLALILGSFGVVYFLAFKKNPLWACVSAFPYLYIFSYRFYVRPELFSFLFISIFIFLILKFYENKKIATLLPLLLIEALWVNLHIYFVVGIILYACFLIAQVIRAKKIDIGLACIFIGILIASIINPQGPRGALEPFTILSQYGYTIVENQSVIFLNQFFFSPQIFMFEAIAILVMILMIINIKKLNLFLILASTAVVIISFKMVRNFPIFVLVSFPLFVGSCALTFEKIADSSAKKIVKVCMICVAGLLVLFSVQSTLSSPLVGFGYYKGSEKASNYFKSHNLSGPIFNNFDIGGSIIFNLYPAEKVFVDGRPEAYSVEFFDKYKKIQENPSEFNRAQDHYGFKTIFFSHTDITPWAQTFLRTISKDKNWKQVYVDDFVVIFVRR